ncbi:ABC transporter substrate-binding protein [Paenibacillus sp. PAMC21692]|uniref:ABC transporter substrate-binding protein n=1 Tax=Paenibacillus sp. PAMC21692 TaxID=2762320 RepID=UPI00164ED267|nr:extracellular solute-binding protein [Paenibacillus sp. PAMC21692]QNK57038.1 extracellular solute-binding protein [Paenibacillus sp. PAMC21692]
MRFAKKGFSLLLIVVMVLVAACSGGNGGNSDPEPTTPPTQTESNDNNGGEKVNEESPKEEPVADGKWEMDFDLGGRTIKFLHQSDPYRNETPEQLYMRDVKVPELEKKHNVKIENIVETRGNMFENLASSVLAGEPMGDAVYIDTRWGFPGWITGKIIEPIDQYVDLNGPAGAVFDPLLKGFATIDNHVYAYHAPKVDFIGLVYNRTMLQEHGIKDLHEYVKEGNWTWDTFREIVTKVTNTQAGIYGYGGTALYSGNNFIASNGGNYVDYEAKKEMMSDPRTIEATAFMQEMLPYSLINEINNESMKTHFNAGEMMMASASVADAASLRETGAVDFGFVHFPVGPSGDIPRTMSTPPQMWSIPVGVEDPEKVLYLLYKMYELPEDMIIPEDYFGQNNLEKIFAYEEDIAEAKQLMNSANYVLSYSEFVPGWNVYEFLNQILLEGTAPATVAESQRQLMQTGLDEAFKK